MTDRTLTASATADLDNVKLTSGAPISGCLWLAVGALPETGTLTTDTTIERREFKPLICGECGASIHIHPDGSLMCVNGLSVRWRTGIALIVRCPTVLDEATGARCGNHLRYVGRTASQNDRAWAVSQQGAYNGNRHKGQVIK